MNYEIHIIDEQAELDPLILHYAERSSIELSYLGGDDKTQPIVASELNFTLETLDGQDGQYDQYFTSDEKRFRVEKRISDNNALVWRGYLLPESYTEPYDNPTFYVSFSAVDGLGLLKGKKLSADFYKEEKRVIDVIAACLKLTNLDFEIWLSPAIRNTVVRKWHEVYLDTLLYAGEKNKDKASVYEFLEEIIESMRCVLYQADGRWFIEGINKRQLIKQEFDVYTTDGFYINDTSLKKTEFTKPVKRLKMAPTPNITMVPPYKEILVSSDAEPLTSPENVTGLKDMPYTVDRAANYFYSFSPAWDFTTVEPYIWADGKMYISNINQAPALDESRKISLREKIYLLRGWRIQIKLGFKLETSSTMPEPPSQNLVESWENIVNYRFYLNDEEIFSNIDQGLNATTGLVFESNGSAEVTLSFDVPENGFLGLEIYEPWGDSSQTYVSAVQVALFEIENLKEEEANLVIEPVDEKASLQQEIDLPISADVSGKSKCFYLSPIRNDNASYGLSGFEVQIPALDSFVVEGETFYVVALHHASLIYNYKENPLRYYYNNANNSATTSNYEVIFNYAGGDLMVVKANLLGAPDYFSIRLKPLAAETYPREDWLKWTDDLYSVQTLNYNEVVAQIERKLFEDTQLRLELTAYQPIKFNDVIVFNWKGEDRYFSVTNCRWNPDENESTITITENRYNSSSFGNLPPYVYAGDDVILQPGAQATAIQNTKAFDPDGVIESAVWTEIIGDGNLGVLNDPLNPIFNNITGDYYKMRLTVTDSQGLTASSDLELVRPDSYNLQVQRISTTETNGIVTTVDEVTIPNLPAGSFVNLSYDVICDVFSSVPNFFIDLVAQSILTKDDGNTARYEMLKDDYNAATKSAYRSFKNRVISLFPGNKITVTQSAYVDEIQSFAYSRVSLIFKSAVLMNNAGNINNLPVTVFTEYDRMDGYTG